MPRPKEAEKEENLERWLLTYSDLITLLLLFFIIMYSISSADKGKMSELAEALKQELGQGIFEGGISPKSTLPLVPKPGDMKKYQRSMSPKDLNTYLGRKVGRKALNAFSAEINQRKMRLIEDERGLVISLFGDIYFDEGSATLKGDVKPVLKKIAAIAKPISNFVRIEGYTDEKPISKPGVMEVYETNWELAAGRSVNVLRYLIEEEGMNPKQLSAVTFGKYRPIGDNKTPEGRALNRRVDIVIVRDRGLEESDKDGIGRPLPDEEWR